MDLISNNIVLLNLNVTSKQEAIAAMASAFDSDNRLADKDQYITDVLKREDESSTAVGFSYATPHAKSEGVQQASLGFMSFASPFKWDEDSEEVTNAFMIGVPADAGEEHLNILANIFRNLMHEDFRESLANASSEQEVSDIVNSL